MTAPTKLDLRTEEQKLLDMGVHEIFPFNYGEILRVVGGWIYTTYANNDKAVCSTFVPFPKEKI